MKAPLVFDEKHPMKPLSDGERAEILPGLDGWSLVEGRDALHKRFVFDGFNAAFAWMTRVALVAERMNPIRNGPTSTTGSTSPSRPMRPRA
jgi:hypothetical protein